MSNQFFNSLQGGVGGFAATAPTMNPWVIGSGVLAGGVLGALQEEPKLSQQEQRFNQATVRGLELQNKQGAINLRQGRQMERDASRARRKKNNIGDLLAGYFKGLR